MAENLNKILYKVQLYFLKLIPIVLAVLYFLNVVLAYFGIDCPIFSYIGGMSLLPFMFILISSFVFKFCIYHRMFLYYILVNNILTIYDYYIGIPITDRSLVVLHTIIAGVFLFVILYLKRKHDRNTKQTIDQTT